MHNHGVLRLILAIAATVIGVVMLIPVVSALTVVGTDESLSSKEISVHDGAAALSMDEQIVPFTKTTATVHVRGDDTLFLGTANGVDTDSYLAGIAHEEITGWRAPGDLETRFISGKKAPEATPKSRDWWSSKDTGKELTHSFDLSAAPSVIVVAPADGKGNLDGTTVTVDVKVTGVFAFCLIGIGVVVLAWGAAAFFFIRWRRGRPLGGSTGRSRGAGNADRKAGRADRKAGRADRKAERAHPKAGRAERAQRKAGHAGRMARRVRLGGAWAGVGALALTASGCSPLPVAQPQAPRAEGYSKVGMDGDRAGRFMSDYVKALDTSLGKNGKKLDELQGDPLLTRTHAELLVAKAQDKRLSAGSFDSVLAGGPAFSSYPMWFMAYATPSDDAKSTEVLVVRRDSAATGWQVVQSLFVPSSSVPELAASSAGAVAEAPDSHTQAQEKATGALVDYLGKTPGKTSKPQGVTTKGEAFSGFRKYVDALTSKKGGFKSVDVECKDGDTTNPKLSSMSLATNDKGSASGGVSTGEVSCELTAKASSSASVDMGKDVEALISGDKDRTTVKIEFSIPYLLTTADGAATVSGSGWFMVSAKTTGKKTSGAASA